MRRMTLTLLVIVILARGALSNEMSVPPDDHRIHFSGRWHRANQQRPWCTWQGSAIRVRFDGTDLSARFDVVGPPQFCRVVIDGDSKNSKRLELEPGQHTVKLLDEPEQARRTVEFVKETYAGQGRLTFLGFEGQGRGLLALPPWTPKLRLEFYGDSNLAGHSLGHEKDRGGTKFAGCYFTFAGILSRMMDAEYHNLSRGGATIAGHLNSVLSFYDRIDLYESEPRWDFRRFPADVCIINIGANDIGRKSKQQIKDDYRRLIRAIRAAHPEAHLVLANGYGWSRAEPANYTHEVVEELGDAKLTSVVFPWLFNEWHGCEYDHAGMAVSLAEHLQKLNPAWKPVRASDVMDGFGRDGNVANGSFEHVAPFGGYGWRYFQDGAQRIHDPRQSPDGAWYLRLPEGKQVHQPTRASKSRVYTYRLTMRGSPTDSQVRVRCEFRDQAWRNEIPNTAREQTIQLTDAWQTYRVSVRSPSGPEPPDPSRDPWQIILRLESLSGTVDIDNILLSDKPATP